MAAKNGKYGKFTEEITVIIEAVKKFTRDDFKKCAVAVAVADADAYADAYAVAVADADAVAVADAYAVADAVADAYAVAYAVAVADADAVAVAVADGTYWPSRRVIWRAILAWLAKDKITQEQFDLLLKPWREYLASISVKPTIEAEISAVSQAEKFFEALNNNQVYLLNAAPADGKDGFFTGFRIVVMDKKP